jgi:hypothetical protein
MIYNSGHEISGINKKGKEFFKFNTNLAEVVTTMHVADSLIWTGGEYTYNIFNDGKDAGFYMCGDKINDLACAYITRDHVFDAGEGDLMIMIVESIKCLRFTWSEW